VVNQIVLLGVLGKERINPGGLHAGILFELTDLA